MNPSVILSFRVKVNSPLYKWLESKSHGEKSMSDVVRDIMDYHRLNNIDDAHLRAVKRNAELWHCMKEYAGSNHNMWDGFWAWMKKEHSDVYKL